MSRPTQNGLTMSPRKARAIFCRVTGGQSVDAVAREYAMPSAQVEKIYDQVLFGGRRRAAEVVDPSRGEFQPGRANPNKNGRKA